MLKDLFRNRLFFGIFIFGLLVLMGCGLYYGRKVANQAPVKVYKPVEVEQPTAPKPPPPGETHETGHWHGDEWHSEPHEPEVSGMETQPPPQSPAVEGFGDVPPGTPADFVNPTSESSNPLFADGVPEHLQCPPEFIGTYAKEDMEAFRLKVMPIYEEILEKWNPNRPISELWEPMIAFEKWCRDNADPERAQILAGQGRVDWLVQMWLDSPELTVLSSEDSHRYKHMVRVDMGDWSPDFNKFTLPDGSGRTFRTDDYKKYVFTWSRSREKPDGGVTSRTTTYTTGPSIDSPNPEVIEINLDTITDEELERLSGWNYNINPYTTGAYKLGDNR